MKPTLMLLPGLLCDATVWAPQVHALGAMASCVVPAYGNLNSLAAMAAHVLATAPSERFSLAGHSMGGRVAFEVMRLAPERVERLALLDTGFQPLANGAPGAAEAAKRMALLSLAQREGMRAMGQQWAAPMVHPAQRDTPLFESILDMIERNPTERFEAQIQALLGRADAAPVMAEIACPTLVLCGQDDAWSPPEQHAQMHAQIAGSSLVVIPECGHMATMERPDAVTDAFTAWLGRP
jgi:pimeloyl-ACP methyl ester carboxylesterase